MQKNKERYTFSLFKNFPSLIHGYFPRTYGSVTQDYEPSLMTLTTIAENLSIPISSIKLMNQVHGEAVCRISLDSPQVSSDYDGLVAHQKGIFLGVKTADCLPLLFYDPVKNNIGACHAGYKGLLGNSISNTLTGMGEMGSSVKDILVGIGPSICNTCYNVEKERIELFIKRYPEMRNFYTKKDGKYYLDLKKIALFQLENEGILSEHVEFSPFCTKENTALFFSRRVEPTGVFLTGIGML